MTSFAKAYPEIITEYNFQEGLVDLVEGGFDAGNGQAKTSKRFNCTQLFKFHIR